MALSARWLAVGFGTAAAAPVIRVLSLSVLLVGVFAVPNALLAREFRQRAVFVANVFSLVAANATMFGLAVLGAGPMAFAWSAVAGQLAAGTAMIVMLGRWFVPRLHSRAIVQLLRFGVPLAGANAINYAYLNLDYAVIGRARGAAALGIYLLAFNVSSWPYAILGASINGVSLPAFSESRGPGLQRHLEIGAQTVASLAFPVAAMISVLATPLVVVLYGHDWRGAGDVLMVLAPYGAIFLITLVLGNALVGLGRSAALLILQVVWLVTLLPAMVVLVSTFGLRGAALAHLAVVLFIALPAYLVTMRRSLGVRPAGLLQALTGPLLLSVAAALPAAVTRLLLPSELAALLVGGAVGGVTYLLFAAPMLHSRLGRDARIARLLDPMANRSRVVVTQLHLSWLYDTPSERNDRAAAALASAGAHPSPTYTGG
jgi:PST family polysaccharide transporter